MSSSGPEHTAGMNPSTLAMPMSYAQAVALPAPQIQVSPPPQDYPMPGYLSNTHHIGALPYMPPTHRLLNQAPRHRHATEAGPAPLQVPQYRAPRSRSSAPQHRAEVENRTWAQVVQNSPRRARASSGILHRPSRALPSQGQSYYPGNRLQWPDTGTAAFGQREQDCPAMGEATLPRASQTLDSISEDPMHWLILTHEHNGDPRSVAGMVCGAARGGHRYPQSVDSALATEYSTPRTSHPPSITSSNHSRQRRTGAALRDRSLPYVCESCGKTFAKLDELRRHTRTHRSEHQRPHPCQLQGCPRRFDFPKDAARHYRAAHEGGDLHFCDTDDCGKFYKTAFSLNRHKASKHPVDSTLGLSAPSSRRTSFSGIISRESSFQSWQP